MIAENSFELDLSRGKIAKMEPIEKFGRQTGMGISDAYDIVDGSTTYSGFPLTDSETMEVLSSSTNDKAGGTGARTITVYNLLDISGNHMPDVTVTLDGTTAVTLGTTEYFRASRAKVRTAGSTGSNVGVLTVRHSATTANRFCIVPATKNQTSQMIYTVPLGKTLHIKTIHANLSRASGAAGSAEVALLSRPTGEVFQIPKHPDITTSLGYDYEGNHIKIEALSDIKGHVFSASDAGSIVYMEIAGTLVDN